MVYCLLLFTQCKPRNVDKNLSLRILTDSIHIAYDQPEECDIRLSDLADSIEYVALETNEHSLVKLVNNLVVTDKHILIDDGCGFLLFSRQGKFICPVGNKGQGPGEYICGGESDIDEDRQQIYIWGIYEHKIFVYDFSGKMLNSFHLKDFIGEEQIERFLVFPDEQYMAVSVEGRHAEMSDTTFLINLKTKGYKKVEGYISGIERKPKLPAIYSYTQQQFCRLEHNGLYQGIVNDIDSGLPFIPRASYWSAFPETYGNTIATFYLPEEIIEYYQENKQANRKWPVCLKEDDNPVVFIVHLKINQQRNDYDPLGKSL
jgi:hypothetical protein